MGASETLTKNRNTFPSGDGKGDIDEGDKDEGENQWFSSFAKVSCLYTTWNASIEVFHVF